MAEKNQNSDKGTNTLEENLALSNEKLTTKWAKFASFISQVENIPWIEARTKAMDLLKDKSKAFEYIESVRSDSSKQTESILTQNESDEDIDEVDYQTLNEVIDIPNEAKRGRFSQNYKRLLKLAPDLETRLLEGERVIGKSKVSGYQDFNLELIHRNKRGFYLALNHYFKQNGDLVADPDMVIRFDPTMQIVEALTLQNQFGYYTVYDDMYKPALLNPREKQTQNAFLEKWLLSLISDDHQMEWVHDEDEEPIQTTRQNKTASKKAIEKTDDSESVTSKIKDKRQITNLYKANYQALLRLFPDLNERMKDDLVNGRLVSTKEPKFGYKIEPASLINKTTNQFVLHDENSDGSLMIAVQKVRKQAWVTVNTNKVLPIQDYAYDLENIEPSIIYKVNEKFSQWLGKTIKNVTNVYWFDTHGLTEKAEKAIREEAEKTQLKLSELRDKNPIVIEWSEGGEDYPKGFNTLDELSRALLLNGFTSKPNDTYIKNKVWFRGYESSWRIDVSKSRGDFDPSKDDLLKYLESGDKKFDWSVFVDKPKTKSKKETGKSKSGKKITLDMFQLYNVGDKVKSLNSGSSDKVYTVIELLGYDNYDESFKVVIDDGNGVLVETIAEDDLSLVKGTDQKESTMKKEKKYDLLFTNAGGVTVASDMSREENGDYKRIAYLTTPITYFEENLPKNVIDKIESMHNSELKKRQERKAQEEKDLESSNKITGKNQGGISSQPTSTIVDEFNLEEAKKDANTIPIFEVGKVEYTEQHKRAGLKKTDINWINKHRQGMILTPRRNPINNTKSLEKDLNRQAKRPGKRISATGRIYYEGRSNRSDLTKSGL
jgi:uncharacterized protein YqiB (DUF1249 family)